MLDSLEKLHDDELRAVIAQCEELLDGRDRERKADAMNKARLLLESVGLSLKDLNGKAPKKAKGVIYKGGHSYQHPDDKTLVWGAKGKKPHWLVELEAEGERPVEILVANDNVRPTLKKTG